MSTTETAQRLLSEPEHWGFCEAGFEYADLQRMAKLWLMLPEIRSSYEQFADAFPEEFRASAESTLLDRLKALEQ